MSFDSKHINCWSVVGTNFFRADVGTRSRFALSNDAICQALDMAAKKRLQDFAILSTCNRTEFYARASVSQLKSFVASLQQLNIDDWQYFYFYSGMEAVRHFFKVVAGLDSQIIGDYEIVHQVKAALDLSRSRNLTGTILDRIANFAFQASKKIKSQTNLSNGKYSVSYAVVKWLKQNQQPVRKVLVIGIGAFGSAVARNIRSHFPDCEITLTNRTNEKAQVLAEKINAHTLSFQNFQSALMAFDTIITTAGASEHLVQPHHFNFITDKKLLLDLSIPRIINPLLQEVNGISLHTVDDISLFHNQWLSQRQSEVQKAEIILEEYLQKLVEWQTVFVHSNILCDYKEKLYRQMHHAEAGVNNLDRPFKSLIKQFRKEGYRGCAVIQTVNEIVSQER